MSGRGLCWLVAPLLAAALVGQTLRAGDLLEANRILHQVEQVSVLAGAATSRAAPLFWANLKLLQNAERLAPATPAWRSPGEASSCSWTGRGRPPPPTARRWRSRRGPRSISTWVAPWRRPEIARRRRRASTARDAGAVVVEQGARGARRRSRREGQSPREVSTILMVRKRSERSNQRLQLAMYARS